MNLDSLKALGTAIEAEKESLSWYLGLAWRTRDPMAKSMFVRLATDEYEHMRLLEAQERSLQEHGNWQPTEISRSMIENLVPRLTQKDVRIRGESGQSELSALETAFDLENRARDFYRAQAQAVANDEAARMYSRLAEMEQSHVSLVQAELDNIQRWGYWFGTREFTLESERS